MKKLKHLKLWENFEYEVNINPNLETNGDGGDREKMLNNDDPFLRAFLEAALWAETLPSEIVEAEEAKGNIVENMDDIFGVEEFTDESIINAQRVISEFKEKAGSLLDGIEPSQAGHDLWLTLGGHGVGFWDRDLGEVGEELTQICKEMKGLYMEAGDDGKVHLFGNNQ